MRTLKQPFVISFIFFLLYFFLILFHELWRDEVQAWSLAMGSHSIKELFYNTRYEGHPKLWFLLLYLLQKFTTNIFYMQLLHIAIATTSVYIFFKYAPFTFTQKILCCVGYFFGYEYAIISRNYAIEIALLFGCIALYLNRKEKSLWLLSILLFFLLQTNVYAVIITAGLYLYIVLDLLELKVRWNKILLFTILPIIGLALTMISMNPPADGGFDAGWKFEHDSDHLMNVIMTILRSYIPIPVVRNEFWNSHSVFLLKNPLWIWTIISLCLFTLVIFLFRSNYKVLIFYLVSTLGIMLFVYSFYFGYMRHYGHLFIILIACCWLYTYETKKQINKYFINTILSLNCVASFIAFYFEIKLPFSNAERTATYLKSTSLDKYNIIGLSAAPTSAIAGLLQQNFYYPYYNRYGTYIIWNNVKTDLSGEEIIQQISNKALTNDSIIAISNEEIANRPKNWELIASFTGAIEYNENYFIYRVHKP